MHRVIMLILFVMSSCIMAAESVDLSIPGKLVLRDLYVDKINIQHHELTTFSHRFQRRYQALQMRANQPGCHFNANLLLAIAYQESRLNPSAVSPTGVRGLMMVTQNTAQRFGVQRRHTVEGSILASCRYLQYLDGLFSYVQNVNTRVLIVLAAYYAGEYNIHNKITFADNQTTHQWQYVKTQLLELPNPLKRHAAIYATRIALFRLTMRDQGIDIDTTDNSVMEEI